MVGTSRTTGLHGGEVRLADPSGALTAKLRIDATTQRLSTTFNFGPPLTSLPHIMLPALYFRSELREGHSFEILVADKPAGPPVAVSTVDAEPPIRLIEIAQQLEEIQRLSHVYFPVPEELSKLDLAEISDACKLLRGETVSGTWTEATFTMVPREPDSEEFQSFARGEPRVFTSEQMYELELGDRSYPLGVVRRFCASAVVREVKPSTDAETPDGALDFVLTPGDDPTVSMMFVPRDAAKE